MPGHCEKTLGEIRDGKDLNLQAQSKKLSAFRLRAFLISERSFYKFLPFQPQIELSW
jgi:hypothetical protein